MRALGDIGTQAMSMRHSSAPRPRALHWGRSQARGMRHEGPASGGLLQHTKAACPGVTGFLSVLSFLTCDMGTGSTSTSRDSYEESAAY